MTNQTDITSLLSDVRQNKPGAVDELLPLVYDRLKQMARNERGHWGEQQTLNTTALVHEAFEHMVGGPGTAFESRAHFFGVASKAMRHILVDAARRKSRLKRGAGEVPLPLDESLHLTEQRAEELLVLDEALERLEVENPMAARIVECRFFVGMSMDEIATIHGISVSSAGRQWRMARTWLFREMKRELDL